MSKRTLWLAIALCSCLPNLLLAQGQTLEQDSIQIDHWYDQVEQHCYTNYDSARHYLDQILALSGQHEFWEEQLYAYLWKVHCGSYHDQIGEVYTNLSAAENHLETHRAALDTLYAATQLDIALRWGDYHQQVGNLNEALRTFHRIAESLEHKTDRTQADWELLAVVYQYIANTHQLRGNYREALDNYFRSLTYDRLASKAEDRVYEIEYARIGQVYHKMGDPANAKVYYRRALAAAEDTYRKGTHSSQRLRKFLASTYNSFAAFYREQQAPDSALHYLQMAQTYLTAEDPLFAQTLYEIGMALNALGRYQPAKDHLEEAVALTQAAFGSDNYRLAKIYTGLGDVELKQAHTEAALQSYQTALAKATADFSETSYAENPKLDQVLSQQDLLVALLKKTQVLTELAEASAESESLLQAAWHSAQLGVDLIDSIKLDYTSESDKQYLLAESYPLFEAAMQVAYRLGETYHDEAFRLAEKSKAVLLYEAIKNSQAGEFAGVPNEELEAVRQLRYQLDQLDSRIRRAKEPEQLEVLRSQRWQLQRQYQDRIRGFGEQYPAYYRLKYDLSTLSAADVANHLLQKQQVLLEYFVGPNHAFVFAINRRSGQAKMYALDWNQQYTKWAATLKDDIYLEREAAYRRKAHQLYRVLLAPVLADVSADRLIIIPDGVLGYVPFAALLTHEIADAEAGQYRQYPYLIRDVAISQVFSASMLYEMQRLNYAVGEELLAFAPGFRPLPNANAGAAERKPLGELVYNTSECEAVLDLFSGKIVTGASATKANFLREAARYRYLHIATHAYANDQAPHQSFVAFTDLPDTTAAAYRLYAHELYSHRLPAELVVLSACETGTGKVVTGEGIISMARAFSYAGVRAIVNTLWNINDKTTQTLMIDFYKQLQDYQPKDRALQAAKLAYLDEAPDQQRAQPKYWAGAVLVGNTHPVTAKIMIWPWALSVLAVVSWVGFFWWRK